MIQVEGLTKRFPVRRPWRELLRHPLARTWVAALTDVTLDVPHGEFFGLLGPNGAGKTTLFKLLSTLVLPDTGRAAVAGHDVTRDPAAVRRVLAPVIADERSLHWRLTPRENLELFAVLYDVPAAERRDRITEVIGSVGLEEAADRAVGTFSSGMKRRLLIARALLPRPRLLLLDEPTASLDPVSASRFRAFLRQEIAGRQGCTVLLATHQTEEALELCDRLAIMDRGRLLALGSARELGREFAGERCRLTIAAADVERCSALLRAMPDAGAPVASPDGDAGWVRLEFDVPGGHARMSALTAALAGAQVGVAGVARVDVPLAELIERVVHARGAPRAR